MRAMPSVAEVFKSLGVNPETGLTAAQVAASKQQFGRNVLTPLPRQPLWKKFLEKFEDPIIRILLLAVVLQVLVAIFKDTMYLVEAASVFFAVMLATGVSFASEYRSEKAFDVLNAEKESQRILVKRNGTPTEVGLDDLAVGDIVILEAGAEVPADGRLLSGLDIRVDQSLMTGESEVVEKVHQPVDDAITSLSHEGCLFRGTTVMDGNGLMVVTTVGDKTQLGQIARLLNADEGDDDEEESAEAAKNPAAEPTPSVDGTRKLESDVDAQKRIRAKLVMSKQLTPLQQKLKDLADLISKVGYSVAGLVLVALLFTGFNNGDLTGENLTTELLKYAIITVTVVVVAVPEGLPMSVTISLALAMRKMTKSNALVRQLMACETVGSTTVICSDKTGTLTKNRMEVRKMGLSGSSQWADAGTVKPTHIALNSPASPADFVALNAAINSTAFLETKDGQLQAIGNSTEGALLLWLSQHGVDYKPLRDGSEQLDRVLFSSDRKRMTTLAKLHSSGKLMAFMKGAPEVVLGRCGGMTGSALEEKLKLVQSAAKDAMRVLCFAHREVPAEWNVAHGKLHGEERHDHLEQDFVFDGFVAIADPLRSDVPDAFRKCLRAGIDVKMITGDNVATARAIATEIGMLEQPESIVLSHEEYEKLTDDELKAKLKNIKVLARATPQDKFRMVKALQELGEVVAVTGDGTNDGPALKRADVGLAMGSGTAVAKEASKIVLLDNSFTSIVTAVMWGRSLYENIQRFLQFQLTINIAALSIAFFGPLIFHVDTPLTAVQLLWVNVIMDTLAAIALCSEPPRESVMRKPPRRRGENIITYPMAVNMFSTALFYVIMLLGALYVVPHAKLVPGHDDQPVLVATTAFFTLFVFFQVWNMLNCRALDPRESAFTMLWRNPALLGVAISIVAFQVIIVTFLYHLKPFQSQPMEPMIWLKLFGLAAFVLVFGTVFRVLRRVFEWVEARLLKPRTPAAAAPASAPTPS